MLEIKEASKTDFDKVWHIFEEVAREGNTYPYAMDISKEEACELWFSPGARVYIAYLEAKPVATRYICPNKPGLGSHVANTGVMIDKDYRGQGIGKQMMDFALNKAKELGYKAIQLNLVVDNNDASIKICKKYGFEIIGKLPEAFHYKQEKYVDAYVMYRKL